LLLKWREKAKLPPGIREHLFFKLAREAVSPTIIIMIQQQHLSSTMTRE
jgi:hypothetical protein